MEFGEGRAKPSSAAVPWRSTSQLRPASAPEPSGIAIVEPRGGRKADLVALEHPKISEQMVAQVDRLGALQMGISRHAPVPVSPREAQQAVHERPR